MTYIHQRKVLAFLRGKFNFRADRYYYFDMAKIDIDLSVFEFSEFESKSEFSAHCKKANTAGLFHIIAYTNCEKEIMIAVNGDGFDYNENLTTGEIENDDCDFGELEPAQLRLDMLQYIRELNNSKNS